MGGGSLENVERRKDGYGWVGWWAGDEKGTQGKRGSKLRAHRTHAPHAPHMADRAGPEPDGLLCGTVVDCLRRYVCVVLLSCCPPREPLRVCVQP